VAWRRPAPTPAGVWGAQTGVLRTEIRSWLQFQFQRAAHQPASGTPCTLAGIGAGRHATSKNRLEALTASLLGEEYGCRLLTYTKKMKSAANWENFFRSS